MIRTGAYHQPLWLVCGNSIFYQHTYIYKLIAKIEQCLLPFNAVSTVGSCTFKLCVYKLRVY